MRLPALDPRLGRIKELLPPAFDCLVDVGTDHGYLPLHLLAEKRVNRVLATDLRTGPLAKAKRNLERFQLADRARFYCCDGLSGLPVQAEDCLVIAGMGGLTIAGILAEADLPPGLRCWLQPMKSVGELLSALPALGLALTDDQLVLSNGRFYRVLAAVKQAEPPARESCEPSALSWPVSPILADPRCRDEETEVCWPAYCRWEYKLLQKVPCDDPRRVALAYFSREGGLIESAPARD